MPAHLDAAICTPRDFPTVARKPRKFTAGATRLDTAGCRFKAPNGKQLARPVKDRMLMVATHTNLLIGVGDFALTGLTEQRMVAIFLVCFIFAFYLGIKGHGYSLDGKYLDNS